jgi:hypothetical protein
MKDIKELKKLDKGYNLIKVESDDPLLEARLKGEIHRQVTEPSVVPGGLLPKMQEKIKRVLLKTPI